MKKQLIVIPMLTLSLLGCDSNDDSSDADSVIIKKNEYYSAPFTVEPNQQIKVKVSLLNEISAEGYIVTEQEFNNWQDVTQTGDYQNATLIPLHTFYLSTSTNAIASANTNHETNWITLDSGMYRLLLENTDYGIINPPNHPDNKTGTTNISYSIHKK